MKKMMIAFMAVWGMVSCTKERVLNEPGNLVPRTVDQDSGLPSIFVNNALLHAEAFGHPDSTLIIVIHGGPGSDYRDLMTSKSLAAHGYRVVFYDQRGSGLSQRFPHKYYTSLGRGAVDLMYDELSGVIAHFRTEVNQKVYLVGHSWGGILAAGYTGKNPEKVDGLVVAEPGGLKWEDIETYVKESRSFSLWGELFNDAGFIDQFISGKTDQHEILDYRAGMLGSKNDITGDNTPVPGNAWRAGAVINAALFEVGDKYHPDFSAGLEQFQLPVLFLYSGRNKVYTDAWAQHIAGAFKNVQLCKVQGVGHEGIIANSRAWSTITEPNILKYFQSL